MARSKKIPVRSRTATWKEDLAAISSMYHGDTFVDLLQKSRGFKNREEALEYLDYVGSKRDALETEFADILDRDTNMRVSNAGRQGHPLSDKISKWVKEDQNVRPRAPKLVDIDTLPLYKRIVATGTKGRVGRNGSISGASEELSLHPFNNIRSRRDRKQAEGMDFVSAFLTDIPNTYPGPDAGLYEQARLPEMTRALAGIKQYALRKINSEAAHMSVKDRADAASRAVRDVLNAASESYRSHADINDPVKRDELVWGDLKKPIKDNLGVHYFTADDLPFHIRAGLRAHYTYGARANDQSSLYYIPLDDTGLPPERITPGNAPHALDLLKKNKGEYDKLSEGSNGTELLDAVASTQTVEPGSAVRAAEKSQDDTAHKESTAPTDEQLQEAVEFLEMVMKIGAPQNQWEQQAVKRIHDVLVETLKSSQRTDTANQPAPRDETVQS